MNEMKKIIYLLIVLASFSCSKSEDDNVNTNPVATINPNSGLIKKITTNNLNANEENIVSWTEFTYVDGKLLLAEYSAGNFYNYIHENNIIVLSGSLQSEYTNSIEYLYKDNQLVSWISKGDNRSTTFEYENGALKKEIEYFRERPDFTREYVFENGNLVSKYSVFNRYVTSSDEKTIYEYDNGKSPYYFHKQYKNFLIPSISKNNATKAYVLNLITGEKTLIRKYVTEYNSRGIPKKITEFAISKEGVEKLAVETVYEYY
jgi:hypothetical protein